MGEHRSLNQSHDGFYSVVRGAGVGRGLGVGSGLGVRVTLGVEVGVGVAVRRCHSKQWTTFRTDTEV
jgi:hypothetical protein